MSISGVVLTIIIFGLLPVCFTRPWIGVLVWSWLGYMNPHRLTWGFSHDMPFAQMVALATIGGLFLTKDRYPLPQIREVYLLLALWGLFFLTTQFAMYPEAAWPHFIKVSKILLMTFVTVLLIQDRKKLQALLWVIALSIGFFGLKGGIFAVLTGGQYQVRGPEDSFFSGNTALGLGLNMVLPILLFIRREETRPWLRHLLLAMFCFSIIAILITYSRGAFLGLVVVLFVLILKSRAKLAGVTLLVIGITLAIAYIPDKWFAKMETIKTYEEDMSAMKRMRSWRLAIRIAADHPVLGVGFRAFSAENYEKYDPSGPRASTDAHSIYFQVLAEHGYTGLALYTGLILSTMLSLRQMIRRSRRDPAMQWIHNYAHMLEVSLWGYLVSGAFLSMSYFDLFYSLVAITIILKKLFLVQEQEVAKASDHAGPQPAFTKELSQWNTAGQQPS